MNVCVYRTTGAISSRRWRDERVAYDAGISSATAHPRYAVKVKRSLASLVLLSAVLVAAATQTPAEAANSPSPTALAASAVLNAKSELSVRVDSSATLGAKKISIVTDAARLYGVQKVTIRQSGAVNRVTAELIDNVIYVKGDASSLETFLNLSTTIATQLSNQWFYIKGTSAEYGEVAQGMTIASGMSEVAFQKDVISHGTKTIDGTKVTVLTGTSVPVSGPAYRETMDVSTSAKPLPVKVVQTFKGQTATFTFSKWNENFLLSAPDAKFQLT